MTVDKFGNYLFFKTQEHRLAAPPILQTPKVPPLRSVCIFNIKGKFREGSIVYLLENNTNSYKIKIEGEIQNIEISSDSVLISVNQNNPIQAKKLIGTTINKGDVIQLIRDVKHPPTTEVFLEIVMLCSLIQNG